MWRIRGWNRGPCRVCGENTKVIKSGKSWTNMLLERRAGSPQISSHASLARVDVKSCRMRASGRCKVCHKRLDQRLRGVTRQPKGEKTCASQRRRVLIWSNESLAEGYTACVCGWDGRGRQYSETNRTWLVGERFHAVGSDIGGQATGRAGAMISIFETKRRIFFFF